MAKVNKQTKVEVAQLLRQLSTAKSAKESARLADEIKKKVEQATQSAAGSPA
jgi:hypothetical protein